MRELGDGREEEAKALQGRGLGTAGAMVMARKLPTHGTRCSRVLCVMHKCMLHPDVPCVPLGMLHEYVTHPCYVTQIQQQQQHTCATHAMPPYIWYRHTRAPHVLCTHSHFTHGMYTCVCCTTVHRHRTHIHTSIQIILSTHTNMFMTGHVGSCPAFPHPSLAKQGLGVPVTAGILYFTEAPSTRAQRGALQWAACPTRLCTHGR